MSYNSVESVFNEAVIEDLEEEAYDASQYGDVIDSLAGLSDIDISLRNVSDGVSDSMLATMLGDSEVMNSELMDFDDPNITSQYDLEDDDGEEDNDA